MALSTVQDYIDRARTYLLDTSLPYRYPDSDLVDSLNLAIMETRRLRPELLIDFFGQDLPQYTVSEMAEVVPIDQQFRPAFVYYIAGDAQLRDDGVSQENRAAAFKNKFTAQMLAIQS